MCTPQPEPRLEVLSLDKPTTSAQTLDTKVIDDNSTAIMKANDNSTVAMKDSTTDSKDGPSGADSKDEKKTGNLMTDDDDHKEIKLVAKDGKSFTIRSDWVVPMSDVVKTALEGDADATSVPLAGVDAKTLALIVEFLKYHKGVAPEPIQRPVVRNEDEICADKWDWTFITGVQANNMQLLYGLIKAANYIACKPLLDLGCARIAKLIQGQPLEKIKGILETDRKQNEPQKSAV